MRVRKRKTIEGWNVSKIGGWGLPYSITTYGETFSVSVSTPPLPTPGLPAGSEALPAGYEALPVEYEALPAASEAIPAAYEGNREPLTM